ncbi:MAG: hypothetical protein LUP99_01750 [Methanomicrobiales archaeon]|nr:hypothetical protein [Methanomicrobiales archaeon]
MTSPLPVLQSSLTLTSATGHTDDLPACPDFHGRTIAACCILTTLSFFPAKTGDGDTCVRCPDCGFLVDRGDGPDRWGVLVLP